MVVGSIMLCSSKSDEIANIISPTMRTIYNMMNVLATESRNLRRHVILLSVAEVSHVVLKVFLHLVGAYRYQTLPLL